MKSIIRENTYNPQSLENTKKGNPLFGGVFVPQEVYPLVFFVFYCFLIRCQYSFQSLGLETHILVSFALFGKNNQGETEFWEVFLFRSILDDLLPHP